MTRRDLWQWAADRWVALTILAAAVGSLTGAKVVSGGARFEAVESRVAALELRIDVVDALALSLCLKEENAIARQRLACGQRERDAGIVRRAP